MRQNGKTWDRVLGRTESSQYTIKYLNTWKIELADKNDTRTEKVDKLKSWKYYNSPSSPGLRPSTCGCSVRFCCCLSLFLKLLSENTVSRYHRAPPRIYLVGALRAGWQLAYPVECSEVRWANYLHDKYLCQSLWAVELSTQIASSTWTYSSTSSYMVPLWDNGM